MFKYIKQNKQVIMVAVSLFVVSMSTLFFFFGANGALGQKDLKTDVLDDTSVAAPTTDMKNLTDQESNYRKILNDQDDPFFVMNINGTIQFTSADMENSLGYTQSDLNGQVFFLLIHPDDLSTFLTAFGKIINDKTPIPIVGPYRLRDKNDEYQLDIGSMVPILNQGNVEEIAVTCKDIDEKIKPVDSNTSANSNATDAPGNKTTQKPQPSTDDNTNSHFLAEKGDQVDEVEISSPPAIQLVNQIH